MDPSLTKILYTMMLFCLPGLFYIWALKDSYRLERFLLGTMLIAWAAFSLGMIAIVIGIVEPLLSNDDTAEYTLNQAREFLPYVSFFGFIYTFMFGGVGTNAISSALMDVGGRNKIDQRQLNEIKDQLESLTSQVDKIRYFHWKHFFFSVVLFAVGIILSLSVWR
ncbi:MAG: hypothetical protein ACJAS3_003247 [Roseivirga sp.]|jgi:hypothetical protein